MIQLKNIVIMVYLFEATLDVRLNIFNENAIIVIRWNTVETEDMTIKLISQMGLKDEIVGINCVSC